MNKFEKDLIKKLEEKVKNAFISIKENKSFYEIYFNFPFHKVCFHMAKGGNKKWLDQAVNDIVKRLKEMRYI